MSRDDQVGAWLVGGLAVAFLLLAVRRGSAIDLATLPAVGHALAVLAVCGVLCLVWATTRKVTRAHAHGSDRRKLARHEAGHVAAARELGWLHSATITGNRGYVDATIRDSTPLRRLTFLLAGQVAEPDCRCVDDDADIRAELRNIPWGERDAVLRQARRDAQRIVSGSWRIGWDTAALTERDRL